MTGFRNSALLALALGIGVAGYAQEIAKVKPPAHPYTKRHLYAEDADPSADITAAIKQAKAEHKRVLLDFGGDWCGDCQVLDIYFHEAPNEDLLAKHFIVVHVFVPSSYDKNTEVAEKYGVPIHKGVPALAVFDPKQNKIIYSQRSGEFNDMRHMDSASVTAFLNHWKA